MKYTETRTLLRTDIRTLCIRENWYTHGTNEDYENMMDLAAGNITTETLVRIAQDIKDHSDTEYVVPQMMSMLARKMICTYTASAEDGEPPMTELDILRAAYDTVLERWGREWDHRRHLIETGKSTKIADVRMEHLDEKLDYLHTRIIALEEQEVR